MEITGTITFVDLSGGFWGIHADNGKAYQPVNDLPDQVRKNGLRIKATVSPVSSFTIFMWGETVQVKAIQPL